MEETIRTIAELEKEAIINAYRIKGKLATVAKALGIGRTTVARKIKEYAEEERMKNVRLTGDPLTQLRIDCLRRDRMKCTECGRRVRDDVPDWLPYKAHMAHIKSRGAGGSDTLDNVRTKCGQCHTVEEHSGGKVVPRVETGERPKFTCPNCSLVQFERSDRRCPKCRVHYDAPNCGRRLPAVPDPTVSSAPISQRRISEALRQVRERMEAESLNP